MADSRYINKGAIMPRKQRRPRAERTRQPRVERRSQVNQAAPKETVIRLNSGEEVRYFQRPGAWTDGDGGKRSVRRKVREVGADVGDVQRTQQVPVQSRRLQGLPDEYAFNEDYAKHPERYRVPPTPEELEQRRREEHARQNPPKNAVYYDGDGTAAAGHYVVNENGSVKRWLKGHGLRPAKESTNFLLNTRHYEAFIKATGATVNEAALVEDRRRREFDVERQKVRKENERRIREQDRPRGWNRLLSAISDVAGLTERHEQQQRQARRQHLSGKQYSQWVMWKAEKEYSELREAHDDGLTIWADRGEDFQGDIMEIRESMVDEEAALRDGRRTPDACRRYKNECQALARGEM